MIQQTHEANKTIIEYLPHRKEWRLLYPWWPKWGFPCEFAACVLKKRFYERTKEKWKQLALLSIIEDRLCWVRDDEYRTFSTKTNLCSWAHSGASWERWKSRFPKSSLNVSRRLYFMISTTSLASCWLAFSRISSRARAFKGRFEQGNKKDVNMTSKLKLMRFPDVWWRACVPLNWVANCE